MTIAINLEGLDITFVEAADIEPATYDGFVRMTIVGFSNAPFEVKLNFKGRRSLEQGIAQALNELSIFADELKTAAQSKLADYRLG
jgi:hypothetical protein